MDIHARRGDSRGGLATERLQAAVDAAAAAGGGTVVVPPGLHRTGALRLRSHVELHLDAGARLQFVADPALYPPVEGRWEGVPTLVHMPCLYARGETHVAVTGFGTIDGDGEPWWRTFTDDRAALAHPRPTLLGLYDCTRVTIRDVSLRNSPSWTVHPLRCDDVTIDNVSIANPAGSPNTDGIDPDSCRNVRISNCHIDVADDCIALKAGTETSPERIGCENVTISNCTLAHGRSGVAIGSEMSGGVRDVVLTNCLLTDVGTGIHLKTRRGRGGVIEDVRIMGVVLRGVTCPLVVNPFYRYGVGGTDPRVADRNPLPVDGSTPVLRRLHVAHLTARDASAAAAYLYGLPEQPLADLTLVDVRVSFADDARPGRPVLAEGVPAMVRAGILAGFLREPSFSGVHVGGVAGAPLVSEHCPGLAPDAVG